VERIPVVVMAGGHGTRLEKVTGMSVPKCAVTIKGERTGLDLLREQTSKLHNVIYSASLYVDWYREHGICDIMWHEDKRMVKELIEFGRPVVIMPSDTLLDASFIPEMIEAHKKGTISWAMTTRKHPLMEPYCGMDIINGAIIGRRDKSILRMPVVITDPEILKSHIMTPSDDLYWDTLPRIEATNAERLQQGLSPILRAFMTDTYCFDYGTPERLETLRKELNEITGIHK